MKRGWSLFSQERREHRILQYVDIGVVEFNSFFFTGLLVYSGNLKFMGQDFCGCNRIT